jgi:PPM family protein phosphatase
MRVLQFTQIGSRKKQEDSLFISDDNKLFVVCDGVGNSVDGAGASQSITNSIHHYYKGGHELLPEDTVKGLISNANMDLIHNQLVGSSSTLALLFLNFGNAYITHLGDSKIFYISQNKWWATKDHSFVQELYEAGILASESEMKSHPLRSRITKAVTDEPLVIEDDIHIKVIPNIIEGDIFILCTDGVLENLTSDELVDIFSNSKLSFEERFKTLQNICTQYSKDNNTAVAILV